MSHTQQPGPRMHPNPRLPDGLRAIPWRAPWRTFAAFAWVASTSLHPPSAVAQEADLLTLEEAVRIALTRSLSLQEARALRDRDEAGQWDGWDRLLPALRLSSGLNQSDVLQRTASDPITGGIVQLPDSLIQLRNTYGTQAALNLDWTLFDGGRGVQEVRRSRASAQAGELAYQGAVHRVVAMVTLAYLDALEAQATEVALRAEVERAGELERTAVGRFDVGEVPEVDVLQARLAVSDAELSLMEAETLAFAAFLELFRHLRLPPDTRLRLSEPSGSAAEMEEPLEGLRERVLLGSPTLASLERRVDAALRVEDGVRWWMLPSVTVGATVARSEFGQNRDALTFSPRNEQTFYRINLSWTPLERPGGVVADRRRARAGVDAARAELEMARGTLLRDVEAALDRIGRARTLQERSRTNLLLAERQLEQAEERYRLGLAPLVDRLTAQALAAEAQRQSIVARYAVLRGMAELELASGAPVLPWQP